MELYLPSKTNLRLSLNSRNPQHIDAHRPNLALGQMAPFGRRVAITCAKFQREIQGISGASQNLGEKVKE